MTYHRQRSLLWLENDWRVLGGLEIANALISGSLEKREGGVKRIYELYLRERRLCTRGCGDHPLQIALHDMWVRERDLLRAAIGEHLEQIRQVA